MKSGNIFRIVLVSILFLFSLIPMLFSAECKNDKWQPTFVRHMSVLPTVFYYTGDTFIPMSDYTEAQMTCIRSGVRTRVKKDTCKERRWGDFSCGCNIVPAPNKTCAAFHKFLKNYEDNALGKTWEVQIGAGKGVWKRKDKSRTFDAVWTTHDGRQETAELNINMKGNVVTVVRKHPEGNCTYTGILASDMKTIKGELECPWMAGPLPWQATIQR